MTKKISVFIFLSVVPLFLFAGRAAAQNPLPRPAISIINPVRGQGLGHETDDLLASLKAQWLVTDQAGVHATWLFQYGALTHSDMTQFAKQEMAGQEFGLWFEIDKDFAESAGVQFRGQGAWYRSDGLFLNSYDRRERRKLIDTAFSQFKKNFGYYPKTVGAWWIGGDSLTYMRQRYGISAALRAADQFSMDFYSIWGTPWGVPYLSAKNNEGIPAASYAESNNVVILQWAVRDPLLGYTDPAYSIHDYSVRGYPPAYVDYLASVYLRQPYTGVVMGLENGSTLESYQASYKIMLTQAKNLERTGKATIMLAKDFATEYASQRKVFAGSSHFLSTAYASTDQSFWYMSENYRIMVQKLHDTISVADFRDYSTKSDEDFDVLPNSAPTLRINEPARIDSMRFTEHRTILASASVSLRIQENGNDVTLYAGNEKIGYFTPKNMTLYGQNSVLKYDLTRHTSNVSPIFFIIALYVVYFFVTHPNIKDFLLLFIPGLLASTLLLHNSVYVFDQKELPVLQALFAFRILPVTIILFISKILPITILFISHYSKKYYYIFYVLTLLLYARVPYFPLDHTTYRYVLIAFSCFAAALCAVSVYLSVQKRSWRVLAVSGASTAVLLSFCALTIIFSRSTIALTTFQIEALSLLQNKHKDVVFVEQKDYGVLPIYKAVKPMLYGQNRIGQAVTGTRWKTIIRPDDHVLKLTDYDNSLVVIPMFLGTEISEYDIQSLQLKQIFGNAQIAIFEKI